MKWKAEEFSLNTKSFDDLNSGKFKSVVRWTEKMQSFGQEDCVMLKSPINNKAVDRSIKGSRKEEKWF